DALHQAVEQPVQARRRTRIRHAHSPYCASPLHTLVVTADVRTGLSTEDRWVVPDGCPGTHWSSPFGGRSASRPCSVPCWNADISPRISSAERPGASSSSKPDGPVSVCNWGARLACRRRRGSDGRESWEELGAPAGGGSAD